MIDSWLLLISLLMFDSVPLRNSLIAHFVVVDSGTKKGVLCNRDFWCIMAAFTEGLNGLMSRTKVHSSAEAASSLCNILDRRKDRTNLSSHQIP
jgi:hypothetical protein